MDESTVFSKQIYGFALGRTGGLLYRLKNIDCCYLVFPNNLDMYLEMLIHDQPRYIVGLGSCSGIDQNKVLIDTICSNQSRNDFTYEETEIKPFLKPDTIMEYTKTVDDSYCNQVSWRIMQLINQGKLHSQYTFLHIPKTLKPWIIGPEIDHYLRNFIVSTGIT